MHSEQILAEAEALLQRKDLPAALQRFEELVRREPDHARHWAGYGKGLFAAQRSQEAIQALERACRLDPDDVASRTELGGICERCCRLEEAIHWHGQALALAPRSLVLRLNHAFIWPIVASSADEIRMCRDRARQHFAQLCADPDVVVDLDHEATHHTFGMAYHGVDDRAWLEAYAHLVMPHLRATTEPTAPLLQPSVAGQRLKLGFASSFFMRHSNSRAFEGLLRGLDRDHFELVLIHLPGGAEDDVRRRLESSVDRVVPCKAHVGEMQRQLQALQLDLLFFTDVGMNATLPALLTQRYAPVQMTGWGFPRTSGFPTLDYYVSGDLVEPTNAQEHYSETLVRLTGLPCRYLSEDLPCDPFAEAMGRQYFLLPMESPLIGCLQTYWKLHPDFDAILEHIARAIPEVWFVFLEPFYPELWDVFLCRLQRNAPTAAERLLPLSRVNRNQYNALAGCLDLLLDTPHFGSGISFYESISTGTPIVTMEGPFLRSRFVAGGYRLMELEDAPIAANPEAMAELTIALLKDPARLRTLRQRIREAARAQLFDRMDMVHSFTAFADEAIERARSQSSIH